LQQLLYFIQVWFIISENKYFLSDAIYAQIYVPMIKSVYAMYKEFGDNDISEMYYNNHELHGKDKYIIRKVLDKCSPHTTSELVLIIHQHIPWIKAYNTGHKISIKSIKHNNSFYF
jgi:uncharacterized phage-associated protein